MSERKIKYRNDFFPKKLKFLTIYIIDFYLYLLRIIKNNLII